MISHNEQRLLPQQSAHHLTLDNVSVAYGATTVLHSIRLAISTGEIVGVIGPNGAGKTTLLRAISGLINTQAGTIALDGVPRTAFSASQAATLGIGHMFQDLRLLPRATILDNVLLGFPNQYGDRLVQAVCSPSRTKQTVDQNTEEAIQILEHLGIKASRNATVESLAYGEQKLVALARLLAMNSNVLLMDEIAAGLSLPTRRSLAARIRELGQNRIVVLSEHDLVMVEEACTRICVLKAGRVLFDVSPQEILGSERLRDVLYGT